MRDKGREREKEREKERESERERKRERKGARKTERWRKKKRERETASKNVQIGSCMYLMYFQNSHLIVWSAKLQNPLFPMAFFS